jgi:hypothetical protein
MKKSLGKYLIAALLLLLVAYTVVSESVDSNIARSIVGSFLQEEMSMDRSYRLRVGLVDTFNIVGKKELTCADDETVLGYVFDLEPTGYLVVPADTRIVPVIAHSYSSSFSWDENPSNILLHMLRTDLSMRLKAARLGDISKEVLEQNQDKWQYYIEPAPTRPKLEQAVTTVYGPWLSPCSTWDYSSWSQRSPYNADCPWDSACGGRSAVGCVATALSQILNYWQHPTSVSFYSSDSYSTSTHSIWVDAPSASFSGLSYNNCDPGDTAKAQISFAAGVSVRMDYCRYGSGAVTARVAPALAGSWYPWDNPVPKRWNYISADLRTYNSNYSWWGYPYYTTEASFFNQMSSNMTQAHPAEMAITNGGGHAINVDGWKSDTREYHLNYGWGGSSDGWYVLPTGMPTGYSVIRYAVMNIVPSMTTRSLTVSSVGSGSGTVSGLPDQNSFIRGTHAILEAHPTAGSTFGGWSGDIASTKNPIRVIMNSDKTVTATFHAASSATMTLASPDGGERLLAGSSHTITWTSQNTYGNVRLEYMTGAQFELREVLVKFESSASTSDIQEFEDHWQLTRLEVIQSIGVYKYGIPPTEFPPQICPYLELFDCVDYAEPNHIYSVGPIGPPMPKSTEWTTIATEAPNTGSYNWSIPNTPSGFCVIKVTDVSNPNITDYSDDHFEIVSHSVSTPYHTSGPLAGRVGEAMTFSAGGASCSLDHTVQYQFGWGDGNYSPWSYSASAVKAYNTPGVYHIRVRARCSEETTILSNWSDKRSVDVSPPDTPAVFRVDADGNVLADGSFYGQNFLAGAADVAEWVSVSEPVEPGDVLELDPENPGHYRKSRGACSTLVTGVVSTDPGFILGSSSPTLDSGPWTDDSRFPTDDSRLATEDSALLALIGIVPVKVTDEGGPIKPGDLLVASSTPGYAMHWDPESGEAQCGLVGKALENLIELKGVILVLLMR